ncbi:tetratricopeptide repeat protein [Paraburkholderia sp. JHI2823]|uniref:tetratricopeptide repeat protein n=1 Tax=Paraburkholderia TaxID=1822464 RepID=UPI00316FD312
MNLLAHIKNAGIALLAGVGLCLFAYEVFVRGPETLIEPIYLSQQFKERGYSEEELQHILVDTFDELRGVARSVTPRSSDNVVASGLELPDIPIPGTGSSVRPLVEYARSLLEKDASVSASVTGSTAVFSVMVTLRESHGDVLSFDLSSPGVAVSRGESGSGQARHLAAETNALRDVMRNAAKEILNRQSPLTYAGYLTQTEQLRCIEHGLACDFRKVRELYERMAARESDDKHGVANAAWAHLALAKLDVFDHNLAGAIRHARQIVERSESDPNWVTAKPWAYYSWGVALNDLGCYEEAADVLQQAVTLNPRYAAGYNALARSWLALATAQSDAGLRASAGTSALHDYRRDALDMLQLAIELDPGYQEAYVNRGDALRLPRLTPNYREVDFPNRGDAAMPARLTSADRRPAWLEASEANDAEDARKAYRDAVALNLDTAGRAYERLVAMHDTAFLSVKERITRQQPRCKMGMVRSLSEAWGCTDASMDSPPSGKGRLKYTAFQRDASQQAVCRDPDAILRDRTLPKLPGDSHAKIIAARAAPAISAQTTGQAPVELLRRVSGRGNPAADADL